jgi:broad specificity phosphatase PhoE
MIRLFLVRHGETDWNRDGRYQGQTDIPLNAVGRRQAALLRDRLRDEQFTSCYSSSLGRAVETAEIVLGGRDRPILRTSGLNELNYGDWEGLVTAEIIARFPDAWAAFIADPVRNAPPGGETRARLRDRVDGVLQAISAEYLGRDVSLLVAAHGGTIRALVASILNISLYDLWKLRQDNAALTIVDLYSAGGEMVLFNDTAHLGPSKSSRPDRPPVH